MDDDLFGRIIRTFGLPVAGWAAFCAIVVHWWKTRNERKRDIAAEKAGDWQRLRDENERLHSRLTECETMRVEWMRRAITAEATLQGYGQAIQQAQVIVSAERLIEKQKPDEEDEK